MLGDGFHECGHLGIVTEDAADLGDAVAQAFFGDVDVAPDVALQVLARHDVPGVLRQLDQYLHCLRAEVGYPPVALDAVQLRLHEPAADAEIAWRHRNLGEAAADSERRLRRGLVAHRSGPWPDPGWFQYTLPAVRGKGKRHRSKYVYQLGYSAGRLPPWPVLVGRPGWNGPSPNHRGDPVPPEKAGTSLMRLAS